ncbi:hypothetical protein HYC85_029552 [Camellia sinensis]|uniref:Uncharacterized protein n=1 Tax=Camellia sinensis TaxID=4442 RepID=A0A7J7FZL5_CAMSI|nr:hypothetical protein HYC85_029552 [Camellia sinensis]
MAKHLKDLLSEGRVSGFRRHFSIPDDVHLSLVTDNSLDIEREDQNSIVFPLLSIAEGRVRFPLHPFLRAVLRYWGLIPSQPNVNFFRIIMGIIELNRCLRIDLGVPAIRHCYALAKSSSRLGRYFLRAKDTDHHLVTMLASSSKRSNLKKILVSADDAVLSQVAAALGYFSRLNLQKQGRAAQILLRYEPTYTTFSAANNIPIPSGDRQLAALIFPSFRSLRQVGLEASNSGQDVEPVVEVVVEPDREFVEEAEEVGEALNSAFEAAKRSQPTSPSTLGRVEFSFGDIFGGLGDLPGDFFEGMAGESLTQMARKKNAERMAARKKVEAARSGPALVESSEPVIEEPAKIVEAEKVKEVEQPVIDEWLIPEKWGKKCSAKGEAGSEDSLADKRPCLEESDVVVPFIVQPKIRDTPIPSNASIITDLAVVLSLATSVSLPADKASFHAMTDLVAIALSAQSALLVGEL